MHSEKVLKEIREFDPNISVIIISVTRENRNSGRIT